MTPDARLVVGVDLGASHVNVAVADLTGAVTVKERHEIAIAAGPEEVLGSVVGLASSPLAALGRSDRDLL